MYFLKIRRIGFRPIGTEPLTKTLELGPDMARGSGHGLEFKGQEVS